MSEAKKTRTEVCKKSVTVEGDTCQVVFKFSIDPENPVAVNASDFSEEIQARLLAHGISQLFGDSYSGKKGHDAKEAFDAKLEQVKGGDWSAKRGDGKTPSLVVQAIARAMAEKEGVKVEAYNDQQERVAGWVARCRTAEGRAEVLANPKIAAHYEAIREERQKARRLAAAKAAKAVTDEDDGLSGF